MHRRQTCASGVSLYSHKIFLNTIILFGYILFKILYFKGKIKPINFMPEEKQFGQRE